MLIISIFHSNLSNIQLYRIYPSQIFSKLFYDLKQTSNWNKSKVNGPGSKWTVWGQTGLSGSKWTVGGLNGRWRVKMNGTGNLNGRYRIPKGPRHDRPLWPTGVLWPFPHSDFKSFPMKTFIPILRSMTRNNTAYVHVDRIDFWLCLISSWWVWSNNDGRGLFANGFEHPVKPVDYWNII